MLEATGSELRSLAQEVEALKSTEQALQRARATLNDRERELEVRG
jgi:prefoldin subunit 5